jgi:serine/threonine protein kinase
MVKPTPDCDSTCNTFPISLTQINQYSLLETVSECGNSKLYTAGDPHRHTSVSVHAILLEKEHFDGLTFERTIRILRSLVHPNLETLHEVLHVPRYGIAFLVSDGHSYGPLSSLIGRGLPEHSIKSIFLGVGRALSYLHSKGIVHHDIRPQTIAIDRSGVAKLGTSGIRPLTDIADMGIGAPGYEAPEAFDDGSDAVLDPVKEEVWALGITMYETAFGSRPGKELELGGVSCEFADLLTRMLDREPTNRLDLAHVLEHVFFEGAGTQIQVPEKGGEKVGVQSGIRLSACVCGESYMFLCGQESVAEQAEFKGC